MNCKQFETWLLSRDSRLDDNMPPTEASHLKGCTKCSDAFLLDDQIESAIRDHLVSKAMPDGLESRIDAALEPGVKPFPAYLKTAAAAAGIFLLTAVAYFGLFTGPAHFKNLHQVSEKAVSKHLEGNLRMTFNAGNIDQAVDMLNRELQFNIVLPDLSQRGFTLLGGRLCSVGDCRAAYLFYRHKDKVASVFIMDYDHFDFKMADDSRLINQVKGLKTDIWKNHSQVYAMVY
jgi:anti-sigma factor RsiW